MGDDPNVVAILLTCTDATARNRLGQREIGSTLERHLAGSAAMDARLRTSVADSAHRVPTGGRTVSDIAASVIALANWHRPPCSGARH
jgi:hypothetical protein